ncbi:N-acetyltransferase [Streptococcus cuniculi]|uniref:N-acetyltransferase n=1 Tax=Streptococcus cuniculi TaxID=1432788 RepID=A0A1Q8E5I8_9STRE|nr:GNAT family N-acetyltransferase [Streptococcus cuniculi]OLF47048.1 N-acetyltransferase [Streptococcus cuniculi]
MVTLRLVDEENFAQVIDLTVAEKDQQFVASNLRSLADCWLYRENGDVFPYAIYADDKVVGFALVDVDDEEACYMIWRLMIDWREQGKGYGKSAILALIEQAKALGKYSTIRADFVKGNHRMEQLLHSLAFTIFGQDDREIFTRRTL